MEDLEIIDYYHLTALELDVLREEIRRLYGLLPLPLSPLVRFQLVHSLYHWVRLYKQNGCSTLLEVEHPGSWIDTEHTFTEFDTQSIIWIMNDTRNRLAQLLPRFLERELEEDLQFWAWRLEDFGLDATLTEQGYELARSLDDYAHMRALLLHHAEDLAEELASGRAA